MPLIVDPDYGQPRDWLEASYPIHYLIRRVVT